MFPVHTKAQVDLAKSKKRKSDECQEKQSHRLHVRKNALWRGHNGTIRFSPLYSSIVNEDGKSSGSCNQSVNLSSDERWFEKQESGFTCWINYILTPDDFRVNLEVTKVNALSIAMGSEEKHSVPKAPTKEELSFSTYTARHRLNRLRRSACQLFTSEVMVKAIQRLELEVEANRLLVRKDRHLWKDIRERQKVLNWLLSYNPLWLRIGLETIY
ncbi:hypothetical protein NHX12_033857 [Muraenolepis orangiensis]|uniref:Uncharacterized protein n=1 Tax=Muraenolepis orangiensis TaxID=630683 RepID=A0A9Q0E4R7_9TELE|nr:hypothetical protein NHX12_033857 [Muraenolepis orangiensis]